MSSYLQAPPGFGHEIPASRMQQYEDDFKRLQFLKRRKLIRDLYRQERAALAAVYAREQARKSAEALSSLHQTPHMFTPEPNRRGLTTSPASLWDDYLESSIPPSHQHHGRGFDDATSAGADTESHLLNNSYTLPNLGPSQVPSRGRSLSEVSDLGGEILSNYQPPLLQSPTSVGPPDYQRAPGAEYSRLDQQQQQQQAHDSLMVGSKEKAMMLEQQRLKALAWPPEGEDTSVGRGWTAGRESWMMEPSRPATSPHDSAATLGLAGDASMSSFDLQQPNSNNQSAGSNTYALFENQSIWSLNNSGSEGSNLLSWAVLGAAEHQKSGKNTDQ